MSKSRYQNSRKADRFKTVTSKVLKIAQNISQMEEIQSKVVLNDFCVTEESKNYTNSIMPSTSCTTSSKFKEKSTDITTADPNHQTSLKSSGSESSSSFKAYKGIQITKSDKIFEKLGTLYRLHQKREKVLEDINKIPIQHVQEQFHELTEKDTVSKRIDEIRTLTAHLKKVNLEVSQLKQKLRKPIFQDVWDVPIHHHRFIVQFFEVSKMLMTDLERNMEMYQWVRFQNVNKSLDVKSFLVLLHTAIVQLEKYFGSLAEFRKTFNDTFDLSCK